MSDQETETSDFPVPRSAVELPVAPRFRPLQFRRLTEQVYEALRKSMFDGEIRPGQRLDTKKLAGDFGVSQTPVRHAVALLAKDGLIEIRPWRGTFVGTVSAQRLSEIMDIRRALELLACETMVFRAGKDDVARLRSLANDICGSVDPEDVSPLAARRHDELNFAFHQSFVALSGNQHLVRLYETLKVHQYMATVHQRVPVWGRSIAVEARQHDAIVDAVAKRNLVELCRAVNRHVRYSRRLLLKALQPGDEEATFQPRTRSPSLIGEGR